MSDRGGQPGGEEPPAGGSDSGTTGAAPPGETPLTPEQARMFNRAQLEHDAEEEADKEKDQLLGSMVGALPVMMGYDPTEPPPPLPPPPQPPTVDGTPPADPDVVPITGDSSSAQGQIYADPGLGDRGDPPPVEPPTADPTDPANVTFANMAADQEGDGAEPDDDEGDDEDVGGIHGEDGDSPEPEDAGAGPSADTPVDTGDATFVNATSDPDPDVVPITGDSSTAQEQIYADPGLGDRGDGPTDTGVTDVIALNRGAGSARPWILPAGIIAAVLVMGAVAFGATRGGEPPQPAPVATFAAPTAPANATVTVSARPSIATVVPVAVPHAEIDLQLAPIPGAGGVGPFGPKCPHPWKIVVSLTVTNAQPGDPVHLVLEGPDIPSDITGTLDGSLSYTTPTWTTTTGTGRWTARVDTVGGRAASSGGNVLNLETCN